MDGNGNAGTAASATAPPAEAPKALVGAEPVRTKRKYTRRAKPPAEEAVPAASSGEDAGGSDEDAPEPGTLEAKAAAAERGEKEDESFHVTLSRPKLVTMSVRVKGLEPGLLLHNFDDKTQKMMAERGAKKAKDALPPRDPKEEFNRARYIVTKNGKKVDGVPAAAFKKGMMTATRMVEGVKLAVVKGGVFVIADTDNPTYLHLQGPEPLFHEAPVRLHGRFSSVAQMRYRPLYREWYVDLRVRYDTTLLSAEQVIALIDRAGLSVGVGEMRPGKTGGEYGQYQVDA